MIEGRAPLDRLLLSFADIPGAPPPGTALGMLAEMADNTSRSLEFRDGDKRLEIFLHRLGDQVVAFRNRCPHTGAPLDWQPNRFLDSTGTVFLCAVHGARFRRHDGFCLSGPCAGAFLQPVAVKVEKGMIYAA
jgi:nitrite reductase/ring-hydroxylating ferredoxin subunit